MISIAKPLIGEEEKAAVVAALESGQLAQGKKVAEFEERFAHYCGAKHGIATTSGTTALHTALLAHGIGEGDEVVTTPFTFIASANSILFTGARPVFADIDPVTFNIDPNQVEATIKARRAAGARVKAVMPVHLFGQACAMDALMEIARRYDLIMLEDACQSHGAMYDGKKVGSFGTGCFSFYPTKNITTGEGGMVTTDDDGVAERARSIRQHGMRKQYYHEMLGFNFRMTDINASIGLAQLGKLELRNEQRAQNAAYLSAGLTGLDYIVTPATCSHCVHVFNQYTIRVKGMDRDQAVERLRAAGVGAGVYYPLPVHHQPLYKELGYQDRMPVAEQACREVLSLPVHPALMREDLDQVIAAVRGLV